MIDEHDDATDSLPLDMPKETAVKPPQRDPVSGQFLPGNKGGGRPKGSKDKVSTKLVALMTELMEKRGEELIGRVADDDPAAALAILTRIVPQAELQRIFLDGDEDKQERDTNITIRLVNQQENQALTHDTPRLVEGELVDDEVVTH
jgi:hypothetical protein